VNDAYIYIRGEFYGAEACEGRRGGLRGTAISGPNALGFGQATATSTVHRGPGPTSAARRPRCSSRSRASRGAAAPEAAVPGGGRRLGPADDHQQRRDDHRLQWYQSLGTPPSPAGKYKKFPKGAPGSRGPKVWCVSGHVKRPGLYDVPFGVSLKTLIFDERFCGGMLPGRKLKGVVPGGSSFQVLTADEIDVPLCFDAVAEAGSSCGSAGIIVMDDSTSMVNALLNVLKFYAHESCGQCTPCREGSGWMMKIVDRILHGQGTLEDLDTIESIAEQACGRTICVLAEAFSWPAQSYIAKFKKEFVDCIKMQRDPAGGRLCAPMPANPASSAGRSTS
jgi:NADH-quinone oxidoreductase subunit F